ncbi:MAG: hypothetical protein HKP30_12800 [Myxococcales bacterium]|nr:hypothetical protein [Myxococcales bacterium]
MSRRARSLSAAALLLAACATPVVQEDELPAEPIALIYRDPAAARERAEELERRRGAGAPDPSGLVGQGVMRLNDADEYFDRILQRRREIPPRLQGRVALLRPRTGEIEMLDAFLPGSVPLDWNASHDRLLVVSRQRGTPQIFEYAAAERRLAPLLRGHRAHVEAAYGPDGAVVYARMDRDDSNELSLSLWRKQPGRRPERLTSGPADSGVDWSPDGRFVLYHAADARGQLAIHLLDLEEGGEPRRIARGSEPAISPLGDWVAYTRESSAGWRLWRMRIDGSGKASLGGMPQDQADERRPTVSPDGRYVVYVAEKGDRQRLRIRRMDGTGDRLLLERGDGAMPAW